MCIPSELSDAMAYAFDRLYVGFMGVIHYVGEQHSSTDNADLDDLINSSSSIFELGTCGALLPAMKAFYDSEEFNPHGWFLTSIASGIFDKPDYPLVGMEFEGQILPLERSLATFTEGLLRLSETPTYHPLFQSIRSDCDLEGKVGDEIIDTLKGAMLGSVRDKVKGLECSDEYFCLLIHAIDQTIQMGNELHYWSTD